MLRFFPGLRSWMRLPVAVGSEEPHAHRLCQIWKHVALPPYCGWRTTEHR